MVNDRILLLLVANIDNGCIVLLNEKFTCLIIHTNMCWNPNGNGLSTECVYLKRKLIRSTKIRLLIHIELHAHKVFLHIPIRELSTLSESICSCKLGVLYFCVLS